MSIRLNPFAWALRWLDRRIDVRVAARLSERDDASFVRSWNGKSAKYQALDRAYYLDYPQHYARELALIARIDAGEFA